MCFLFSEKSRQKLAFSKIIEALKSTITTTNTCVIQPSISSEKNSFGYIRVIINLGEARKFITRIIMLDANLRTVTESFPKKQLSKEPKIKQQTQNLFIEISSHLRIPLNELSVILLVDSQTNIWLVDIEDIKFLKEKAFTWMCKILQPYGGYIAVHVRSTSVDRKQNFDRNKKRGVLGEIRRFIKIGSDQKAFKTNKPKEEEQVTAVVKQQKENNEAKKVSEEIQTEPLSNNFTPRKTTSSFLNCLIGSLRGHDIYYNQSQIRPKSSCSRSIQYSRNQKKNNQFFCIGNSLGHQSIGRSVNSSHLVSPRSRAAKPSYFGSHFSVHVQNNDQFYKNAKSKHLKKRHSRAIHSKEEGKRRSLSFIRPTTSEPTKSNANKIIAFQSPIPHRNSFGNKPKTTIEYLRLFVGSRKTFY